MANADSQTQAFALAQSLPHSNDLTKYITFAQQAASSSASSDRTRLLAQIPRSSSPSYGPLATLSALLGALPGQWPVLRLQQTYTELWKQLPDDAKAGKAPMAAQKLLDLVLRQCKDSYSSMTDLFHPTVTSTAMINPEDGNHLTHSELASCVSEFRLPVTSAPGQPKPVVAISLPNGPTLALTVLAVASFYTAAPVAHGSGVGAEQFKSDILQ